MNRNQNASKHQTDINAAFSKAPSSYYICEWFVFVLPKNGAAGISFNRVLISFQNEEDQNCNMDEKASGLHPTLSGANTTNSTHSCDSKFFEVDVNVRILHVRNVNQANNNTIIDHSASPTSSIKTKDTMYTCQYYQLGGFCFAPKRNIKLFWSFSGKTTETVTSRDATSEYDPNSLD